MALLGGPKQPPGLLGRMSPLLTYAGLGLLSQGPSLTPQSGFQGLGQGLALGMDAMRQNRLMGLQERKFAAEEEERRMEAEAAATEARQAAAQREALVEMAVARGVPREIAELRASSGMAEKFLAPQEQWSAPAEIDLGGGKTGMAQTGPGGKVRVLGSGGINIINPPAGYMPNPNDPSSMIAVPGGPADPTRVTPTEAAKLRESESSFRRAGDALSNYRDVLFGTVSPETGQREGGIGGAEFTGPKVTSVQSARTRLLVEAKNLAELGALSGPDMALVNELIGPDPTSFGQNIKDLFMTDEAMMSRYAAGIDEIEKMLLDARAEIERRSGNKPITDEIGTSTEPPSGDPLPSGFTLD